MFERESTQPNPNSNRNQAKAKVSTQAWASRRCAKKSGKRADHTNDQNIFCTSTSGMISGLSESRRLLLALVFIAPLSNI